MALPFLIAIGAMWFTVAVLFLGKGEAKGTGFVTACVGAVTIIISLLLAAWNQAPGDRFLGGLLFAHGIFYSSVAYALLAGLEDLRSTGNVALYTCLVSLIYMILYFTGAKAVVDGKEVVTVAQSTYLAFGCLGYAVLTFMVWLNANGKFPAVALAWALLIWVVLGLWAIAFPVMAFGKLPF